MQDFFKTEDIGPSYDIVIIGAGPAGCTAALYAARDALKVLVLEKNVPGGQMGITADVENHPGFPETISGYELSERYYKQAKQFGALFRYGVCREIKIENDRKLIFLEGVDKPICAKAVIIATGCQPKQLGVPGETKFWGRGVSACATCDGGFYKNKVVAAVGGGNTAVEEGEYLTRFASKVYLIHRREEFRASAIAQAMIKNNPKIELLLNSVVESIDGDTKVESVTVKNLITNEVTKLTIDGIFIFVGQNPIVAPFKDLFEYDESGFIIADETTVTKHPGILVAGDVRSKSLRQIVTAISDGAVAAKMAERYIQETKHTHDISSVVK